MSYMQRSSSWGQVEIPRCHLRDGPCRYGPITEVSYSAYVAAPSTQKQEQTYRLSVKSALLSLGYEFLIGEKESLDAAGDACKICQLIQKAGIGIIDVGGADPDVHFELGLMLGFGKETLLLRRRGATVVEDLAEAEFIEYENPRELSENLLVRLYRDSKRESGLSLSEVRRIALAIRFFEEAGFQVLGSQENQLQLVGQDPQFERYGETFAWTSLVEKPRIEQISETFDVAQKLYDDMRGKIAFMVVSMPPESGAQLQIYAYKHQENFTIVPLTTSALERAVLDSTCRKTLGEAISAFRGSGELYSLKRPVQGDLEFFGRGLVIDELMDYIEEQKHFGLFGIGKIGKTSVLLRLRERLSSYPVAYLDLQRFPRNWGRACYEIIMELNKDIMRKYSGIEIPPLAVERRSFDRKTVTASEFESDLSSLLDGLDRARGNMKLKVVLLLDEIGELIPSSTDVKSFGEFRDFLSIIRGISQERQSLVIVIVGRDLTVSRKQDWGDDLDNPMFQFYEEVFLPPLEEDECKQMITDIGGRMGLIYSDEALAMILKETGRHPFVTRELCALIVQGLGDKRPAQIGKPEVERAASNYVEDDERYPYLRRGIWRQLSKVEREIVRQIAKYGNCEITSKEHHDALSHLKNYRLVIESNDEYRLGFDLLRKWIIKWQ